MSDCVTENVEFFRVRRGTIEYWKGGRMVTSDLRFENNENLDLACDLLATRSKTKALLNKGSNDESIRLICNFILREGYQL